MANHPRRKKDTKTFWVRIISMGLAILMILSVALAAIWQW